LNVSFSGLHVCPVTLKQVSSLKRCCSREVPAIVTLAHLADEPCACRNAAPFPLPEVLKNGTAAYSIRIDFH
jgi:hypothetical protein